MDASLVLLRGLVSKFGSHLQVLKDYQGTISLKELSEMTAIKVEDVVSTLQHLNLIQYQKGQHVICAAPKLIERSACNDMPGMQGLLLFPAPIKSLRTSLPGELRLAPHAPLPGWHLLLLLFSKRPQAQCAMMAVQVRTLVSVDKRCASAYQSLLNRPLDGP